MEALKPCPFCGGDRVQLYRNLDGKITGLFCRGCKATVMFRIEMAVDETFGENERKWAATWNRREKL